MSKEQLHRLLGYITGHLVTASPQQETEVERLHHFLSRSLLSEDAQQLKGSSFSFESADLFSHENIPAARLEALQSLSEKREEGAEPEFRVFVREVPVRSTQLQASVPLWAGGAAVDQTIGPFTNRDGRQFWFDFFAIEKLVALYVQGRPDPALLFKTTVRHRFIDIFLPLTTDLASSYDLPAGSIWINSQIFASNAPSGFYTGLTIKGGHITLSAPPQTINGKLTVKASAVVTVKLDLQQAKVTDADDSSPYGVDAREAEVELPEHLAFHFSGSEAVLDKITDARWNVYGHEASFNWNAQQPAVYDNLLHRVLIPFTCSELDFEVSRCQSPFHQVRGRAPISRSAWALTAAQIDILHPTPAAGTGALLVKGKKGLTDTWKGLKGGELSLNQPYVMAEPGRINITDLAASNMFCQQTFNLWQDKQNPFGTSVELQYPQATPFFYNTFANGNEALAAVTNADVKADRPVTVAGEALAVRSKNSLLILAVSKTFRLVYLLDDNILLDNLDLTTEPPSFPKPIALALRNALFKVTPANGCLLFGLLTEDFVKVDRGYLYLTFGMYAYLPTLPDPYAVNLMNLRSQFRGSRDNLRPEFFGRQSIWLWLVCLVNWHPSETSDDELKVSFHFAPLQNQFQLMETTFASRSSNVDVTNDSSAISHPLFSLSARQTEAVNADSSATSPVETSGFAVLAAISRLPDYGKIWNDNARPFEQEDFALLDVSTNADLLGISFGVLGDRMMAMITTHLAAPAPPPTRPGFPLQVQGMDVVSRGSNVRAFTVPQISWEPVLNLTQPLIPGDPKVGVNYYEDDGGPTRLINFSEQQVALAPIPLTNFLVNTFERDDGFIALTLFTLPFGLKALAVLQNQYKFKGHKRPGTNLQFNSKSFENELAGARQLEVDAGQALVEGESNMFVGSTIQVNNVLEMDGTAQGNSTLGASVTKIFNNEFLLEPFDMFRQRGVPLTRMDLSGYGASIFSSWFNTKATIAATSQAKFDVFVGRCAHEVIQVKSIVYPWLFRVVRTITLFRTGSGYVYRYDSGWRAESDGKFDLRYYVNVDDPENPGRLKPEVRFGSYQIHPGVVTGLFNIKEIKETTEVLPFLSKMVIKPAVFSGTKKIKKGDMYVDINGEEQENETGSDMLFDVELQPVYFDADAEIEDPVSGFVTKTIEGSDVKVVPSKRILGFVQIKPRGMPISTEALQALITRQGTIGGPIDCVVNIARSGQQMRHNRFDMSNSFDANGSDPIFVAAGRGNVILPKDGSWSMVKHEQGTGEVSPVPQDLSVPLIRIGKLVKHLNIFTLRVDLVLDRDPEQELLRIANPTELLRPPVADTINYGFLQSTDTQKALFLTPSFRAGVDKLLSKTPPLFVDAFRIVNSKAIFPNIGDAASNFGDAISLVRSGSEFAKNTLTDGGKQVLELMQVNKVVGGVKAEGYKLLKNVPEFDLPPTAWNLIEIGGAFKIYIEYRADNIQKQDGKTKSTKGSLDFDVDSFATNLADTWKSRMKNVALVVDLGPIKRLMTIKGHWDSKKGTEAQYKGDETDPDFPSPQIEFSPELKPVIEILEILQDLQGDNYKDAFQKGLKLAMSNKAGTWEYKFEAAKEIPVVRFPMPNEVYNQPTVPLKLEAGLKLGAYFNAALKVTTDPKQLLPTAGGFMEFYGRLSVMCVSLAAATVYAVGQVNLRIAADTKIGPSLAMKFGFGAQIVVGLPVVGNVSVLYMVGIEIYIATGKVAVSASLLFQGHAELLAGLISVTITIEAKGTVTREGERTDLAAQVTFGLDISIFLVIDISFSTSWGEQRQIA